MFDLFNTPDLITWLISLLPIVGFGSQQASGSGQQQSEGASKGQSKSDSTYTSDSASTSLGKSASNAVGTSSGTGSSANSSFGFSGLAPSDTGVLSNQIGSNITSNLLPAAQRASNVQVNYPTLDERGLTPEQNTWADSVVRQGISQLSSDAAARGQVSPQNTSAIAGQALSNVAPALLPIIQRNIEQRTAAPLQQAQAQVGLTSQAYGSLAPLLGSQTGSQGTSQQQQQASNLSTSTSDQFASSLAKSLAESQASSASEAYSKAMSDWANRSWGFQIL